MDYLTTHTSLSLIWRVFTAGFVNYKNGCTRLTASSDKAYQLLAHGRWFSSGTPASSTTKTGCHDIAEILLKVTLNTINEIKSNLIPLQRFVPRWHIYMCVFYMFAIWNRELIKCLDTRISSTKLN